jgi:hypothetical protein
VWLTNGSAFTVSEVTDVVVTVTDMGPVKAWGDFAVGRVYDAARYPGEQSAQSRVRVTSIKVNGADAALPTGANVWDADTFNGVGILTGKSDSSATIEIRTVRVGDMPAGATVMLGDEIVNSLSHRGYRVDAIEVATVAASSASARLPDDSAAVWADDLSTFDVTMPTAARTSLVVSVTDAGLSVPIAAAGAAIDQPYWPATIPPPFVKAPQLLEGSSFSTYNHEVTEQYNAAMHTAAHAPARYAQGIADRRAHFAKFMEYFPQKYAAKMDWVRTIAGIPPKSDASGAGSPCWRDHGGTHWWEDAEGFYLPAFTGKPFVSARRLPDGKIVSTQEFGFGLITQCGHRLKEGDRITIRIAGTNSQGSWAEGDRFVIPLIGAASAPLTGGANGDPTQTWTVRSSVLGALADWAWLAGAPTPWAHAPATVELTPGGIPFEVGDSVAFGIEGGALRWRRDTGSWTTANLYGGTPLDLGDGLHLVAEPGTAPSFAAGDTWQFSAIATHGVARMRQPRIGQAFAWDGDAVTLDVDFGSAQPLEVVMLALHSVPLDATVVVSGGLLGTADWTLPAELRKGIILAVAPRADGAPPTQARYLRVVITGAGTGGSIGWLWAGMGWQPTVGPSRMTLKRQYGLARGAGINPAALYRGAGTGGSWSWDLDSGSALLADNAAALVDIIDHSVAQGLEPLALFPNIANAVDASIALIDADEIAMEEFFNWQDHQSHVVSLDLPLRAVLA